MQSNVQVTVGYKNNNTIVQPFHCTYDSTTPNIQPPSEPPLLFYKYNIHLHFQIEEPHPPLPS